MDLNSEVVRLNDQVESISAYRNVLLSQQTIRFELLFPTQGIVTLENP
jgi:hypothetical protein